MVVLLAFGVASELLFWPSRAVPPLLDDLTAAHLFSGRAVDAEGAPVAWHEVLWPTRPVVNFHDHWRPLGWISIALDQTLFGWDFRWLRGVAVLWHAINALLVAGLIRCLAPHRSRWTGILGGVLFLVWAGSVETVVWVSHRFTLLATAGFLSTAILGVRYAHGQVRLGWVMLMAGLTLLTKDSQLSELGAVVPLVALASPAKGRWRNTMVVAAAVAGPWCLVVGLRYLLFRRWLPQFVAGTNVVEGLDLARILEGLPALLRTLLWPSLRFEESGATAQNVAILGLGVAAFLLVVGGVRGATRSDLPAFGSAFTALIVLLCLGLPTLHIGPDLDGTRRLYLPAALVATFFAALAGRRPLLLLPILLWHLPHLIENQASYRSASDRVHAATARIDALDAGAVNLLLAAEPGAKLASFPATTRGAPVFGPEGTHFRHYFQAPLAKQPREVRIFRGADWPSAFLGEAAPRLLLIDERAHTPSEWEEWSLRRRELTSAVAEVTAPLAGADWPGRGTIPQVEIQLSESRSKWRAFWQLEHAGRSLSVWTKAERIAPEGERRWRLIPEFAPLPPQDEALFLTQDQGAGAQLRVWLLTEPGGLVGLAPVSLRWVHP